MLLPPPRQSDRSGEGVPPTHDQNWCLGVPRVGRLLPPLHHNFSFSLLAVPLSELTKKDWPDQVAWTDECKTSFQALKDTLCSNEILRPLRYNRPFSLQTDASSCIIGAVLTQKNDDLTELPVDFFSRKMAPGKLATLQQKKKDSQLSCLQTLPSTVGSPLRHLDRSQGSRLSKPSRTKKSKTCPMDGHTSAIFILHTLQTWKRELQCRWSLPPSLDS